MLSQPPFPLCFIPSAQHAPRHYYVRAPSNFATAKKNIAEHYDLTGLYHHFLDDTMAYSCGIFKSPSDSLYQAQLNKIESTIAAMRLRPGDTVLEIGCGWGALAVELGLRGHRVHGLTLSEEQLAHVEKLVRRKVKEPIRSFAFFPPFFCVFF